MRVGAGVDQLGDHSHPCTRALHTAFQHVRHAERSADFAQVVRDSAFILHDRGAADHFQVRDPGEMRQDFILHAFREI